MNATERHTQYTKEWTPWGLSDSRTHYGLGVTFYSTPSHGGFHLDEDRLRGLTAKLGVTKTYCGYPDWFEEDCDWSYVALAFPDLFTFQELEQAYATADWLTKRHANA